MAPFSSGHVLTYPQLFLALRQLEDDAANSSTERNHYTGSDGKRIRTMKYVDWIKEDVARARVD